MAHPVAVRVQVAVVTARAVEARETAGAATGAEAARKVAHEVRRRATRAAAVTVKVGVATAGWAMASAVVEAARTCSSR